MKKHSVEVKISGSGNKSLIYVFGDEVLKKLINNSKSDEPIDCRDFLEGIGVESEVICHGIDAIDGDPEVVVTIDGEDIQLSGLVSLDDLDDFDEDYEELLSSNLKYSGDNIFPLEGAIPNGKYAVIVVEYCGFAHAIATFKVNEPVDVDALRVNLVDVDVESDYSLATYGLDLLGGMERDLKSISYGGHEYEFRIREAKTFSRDCYLIEKNSAGKFQISENSNSICGSSE